MVVVNLTLRIQPSQTILSTAIPSPTAPGDIPPVQELTKRREERFRGVLVRGREVRTPPRGPPDRHVAAVTDLNFALEPGVETRCAP